MNNAKITIRPAQLSDITEMQTLFVNTIVASCKDDYSADQIKVWTTSMENTLRWKEKLTSQYFLVAILDHKIVGYASLENNYLDFLYVHKNYQRQGIADRLYSAIEAEALKNGDSVLFADVSITAKPFFEKKGFITLQKQTKIIHGVEIINFKMTKRLRSTPKSRSIQIV